MRIVLVRQHSAFRVQYEAGRLDLLADGRGIDPMQRLGVARARPSGGRRVVFLASDDDGAAEEIGALAENLGFSPIKLGGLSEGGLLVQARGNSWGRLVFKDLVKFDG